MLTSKILFKINIKSPDHTINTNLLAIIKKVKNRENIRKTVWVSIHVLIYSAVT